MEGRISIHAWIDELGDPRVQSDTDVNATLAEQAEAMGALMAGLPAIVNNYIDNIRASTSPETGALFAAAVQASYRAARDQFAAGDVETNGRATIREKP